MGFAPLCVVQKVSGQTYRSAMSNKIVDPNFSFVLPLWGIERCCFMFDWKSKKLSGLLDAYIQYFAHKFSLKAPDYQSCCHKFHENLMNS